MIVTAETIDSKIVLHANGRIDARTAQDFEKEVFEGIGPGKEDVIIDFNGIDYISSAGLRSLLLIAKHMRETDRHIVLCAMSENVIDVIRITGFSTLFYTYPDLQSAIKQEKK